MIFLRYLTEDEVVVEKEEQVQRREKDQAEFIAGVYPLKVDRSRHSGAD